MDMEALKEAIRLAIDGFGGSDIACVAACLGLEDLECAQGENWEWVQTVLSDCPAAKEAALAIRQKMEERNILSRSPAQDRVESWRMKNAPYLPLL
ncbi:hypothetical protein MRM75_14025 [bacterium 19CA06SA08-2]|uniref:Uncharacterized protein n=1 Tax=bacterium 19CA06SA08-2 TaxID=2920658 RepID=A0AAU6U1M3_UNCXX